MIGTSAITEPVRELPATRPSGPKQATYQVTLTSNHANGEGLPVSDNDVEVALLRHFPNVEIQVSLLPPKRGRGGSRAAERETR